MEAYAYCRCGTKVEVDAAFYGKGCAGVIPHLCEPCYDAEWERREFQARMAEVMGPGPAVFDGDW